MKKIDRESRKASVVTDDLIAETIYDPVSKTTQFAVLFAPNEVGFSEEIQVNGETIYPLDAKNDIVSKGVVLLPSTATDYVSDTELLNGIQGFIHKYLDISPMFERIASYYVLFSWLYDRFYELPYLRAIGDYGSGKTRFLQAIGSLCYRPIFTGGATTTAPIFRILDEIKGTLILDEADLRFSDMTTDIVKILNMGYQRGGSVLRMQGKEKLEMKAFDVFSPKIVATRETFSDKALESRFLVEHMGSSSLRKDIPRRLSDEFYDEARELRNKLLMWRFKNYRKELLFDDAEIEGIHPRLHQIVIPLLTIIEDEEMKISLKDFVKEYNGELASDRGQSWEADVTLAILRLAQDRGEDSLTVKEISEETNRIIDFSDDHLHARKVGWIMTKKLHLKTHRTRNGYTLSLSKNRKTIERWKECFGITDEDIQGNEVNDVNDVHVTKDSDSLKDDDEILF